jgi:hypothetical protein
MRPTDERFWFPHGDGMKIAALLLVVAVVGIAIAQPFTTLGEYMFGDGGGNLVNGAAAMFVLVVGGLLLAIVAAFRRGKQQ